MPRTATAPAPADVARKALVRASERLGLRQAQVGPRDPAERIEVAPARRGDGASKHRDRA